MWKVPFVFANRNVTVYRAKSKLLENLKVPKFVSDSFRITNFPNTFYKTSHGVCFSVTNASGTIAEITVADNWHTDGAIWDLRENSAQESQIFFLETFKGAKIIDHFKKLFLVLFWLNICLVEKKVSVATLQNHLDMECRQIPEVQLREQTTHQICWPEIYVSLKKETQFSVNGWVRKEEGSRRNAITVSRRSYSQ